MRVNWFFRRNRCCCCCRRCNVQTDSSSGIYTVYSLQHFANVPMQIYYGPGYTERNVLENMDDALQTIAARAETLQTTVRHCSSSNSCNSCNSCDSCNFCNSWSSDNSCNSCCSC